MRPFFVSPSKIRTFLECPRKYWWLYVNPETRGKQPEYPYWTLGRHVHSALRDFFATTQEERAQEQLSSHLNRHWQTKSGKAGGFESEEKEAAFRARGEKMLNQFLKREDWRAKPVMLSPQEGYQKAVVDRDLIFIGVIDRVDESPDGLHIIDYKTGKTEEDDPWQLPMYAVMVGKLLERHVGQTTYHFLESGRKISSRISIQDNVETLERVRDVVAKIPRTDKREAFVCRLGDECPHCDYLRKLGIDPNAPTVQSQQTKIEAGEDLPF